MFTDNFIVKFKRLSLILKEIFLFEFLSNFFPNTCSNFFLSFPIQAGYDIDQALVLCQMHNFTAGILYLYEKAEL